MDKALADGHASFTLDGKKLSGGFALTRMRTGKDETWLLVKRSDDRAHGRGQPIRNQATSALSGKTLEEIEDAAQNKTRTRNHSRS
jgi:hypothetical protein